MKNSHLNYIMLKMPGYVYWKDKNSKYMGCNQQLATLSGLKHPNDIVGLTDHDFEWGEEEADSFVKEDKEVLRTGEMKVSINKLPILRDDGQPLWIRTEKMPLYDDEGNVVGVLGVAMDITDQKEAEWLRAEKAAAEKREETLRLLAASIAHEMRTPLQTIDLNIAGLAKNLPSLLDAYNKAKVNKIDVDYVSADTLELLADIAENIHRETREAFAIVDMLVFKSGLSNIDTKNFTTCSMAECIEKALERYPFAKGEREKVTWDGQDFHFYGDTQLMIHIIFNLLKNSLYYIAEAGKGDISIWLEKTNEFNKLHFKDTGTGIPEKVFPRIFEAFFTTLSHGTGVGLAFSKFAVKSMKGDIECLTEPKEYTEFILSFPRSKS